MSDVSLPRQTAKCVAPSHRRVAEMLTRFGQETYPLGTGCDRNWTFRYPDLGIVAANEPKIGLTSV